jgi:thymidylate kinase
VIVEFIGCSGAGKTTLAKMLRRSSSLTDPVILASDLVMDRPGRRWISNPTAMNLVADVTALPSFLRAFDQNQDFARYAAERLRRHAPSVFAKVNYMRNIVRRIGMHELARREGGKVRVLADEGTVLTAYYLFVYSDAPVRQSDLDQFAQLVPMPDRIVHVKAPVEVLVNRSLGRPDRRRELAMNDQQKLQHWIARAQEVFEGLSATPRIRDRVLTVENVNAMADSQGALTAEIVAFIRPDAAAGGVRSSPGPDPVHIRRRHDILRTIKDLVEDLNDHGIQYCHWKSNWALDKAMMGRTDLDLLIHKGDVHRFREILKMRGFVPVVMTGVPPLHSVEHYHALDRATGTIVHVHAYYRVVTGESLAKNYRLPVEDMLLSKTRKEGIVNIPAAGAELIIFVLRMSVKHTTVPELVLLTRQWSAVSKEVAWLLTDQALEEATELLPTWLPEIDTELFLRAYEALRRPASLWRRIVLGLRLRGQLRSYARRGELQARWIGAKRFTVRMRHRLTKSRRKLTPAAGGALIALVGSEATGKSTLLDEVQSWLSRHYTVRRIHAGKPPSTLLTLLPHTFLPVIRRVFPEHRSTRVQAQHAKTTEREASLLFALRSAMLAYERRMLLARASAWSKQGEIALSDRYPSLKGGAPDSPQLSHLPGPSGRISLRRWLTGLEARLYRDVPNPDLVIYLTAPLEVTIARNEARDKTEAEEYVRFRHTLSSNPEFNGVEVKRIVTDKPLEDSVQEVKEAIWDTLLSETPETQAHPVGRPQDPA